MKLARTALALALATVVSAPAAGVAARQPDHLAHTRAGMELANGDTARAYRSFHQASQANQANVPTRRLRPWAAFVGETGPQWRGMWDRATGVPARLYGKGIHVPGSMDDPRVAEAFAREFFARHVELLAPGATASDFSLASNVLHAGIRSVGFYQHHDGLRVLGGQVSFRFKNDRMFVVGSEAYPHVTVGALRSRLDVDRALASARQWLLSDVADTLDRGTVDGPFILPIVADDGVRAYRTTVRVTMASQPVGRWDVYVDAHSGEAVARKQTLMFGDGTLLYDAPLRRPTAERGEFPVNRAYITVNGDAFTTGLDGVITWAGDAAATLSVQATGAHVQVIDHGAELASGELALSPGGEVVWSSAGAERVDAQLATFVHTMLVKEYVRGITPDMAWLDESLNATVNIDDDCNAFSDGTNINFFTSGGGCENTGRLADVVYHEFGHAYHAHSIIPGVGAFDGALSEGVSDYLAATIVNDPGIGRGFYLSDQALRHLDPEGTEKRFPDDLIDQVHTDGEIIGGTLWDLRTALVASLGPQAGVERADFLFQAGISRAVDMPTMYPEILAADDDDGNLSNGTPNLCDINAAFGAHGMRSITTTIAPLGVELPDQEGFHVSLAFEGLSADCGNDTVASATVEWQLRADTATHGKVVMETADGTRFDAFVPPQPEGAVVQYRILVAFEDGSEIGFPDNAADPYYELFVGEVEKLYCTDFEIDPEIDGWTHGLTSGVASDGADDWMWGEPAGMAGSGDPGVAFSGARVFGNDLGGSNFNGSYQSDKVNFARSPAVDVGNYSDVRLQYRRWLNVEDGFFDQATIYANDVEVWSNLDSNQGNLSSTHHQDREWRFHDVDVSSQLQDGKVEIKFEIASDGGFELGGWTIDDFCIVAYTASVCGDGAVTGVEACDDGADNADAPDACRLDCQAPVCGDGIVDSGERCDDGNELEDDHCTNTCERPPGFEEPEADCGCRTGAPAGTPPLGGLLVLGLSAVFVLATRRRG